MKKILMIEDDDDSRENMAEILELAGYSMLTAANGREGVTIAIAQQPDLIICDIDMPELDGYAVLHLLQNKPGTKTIPFIFLTAKVERSEMRRGMELGADDYITKPCTSTELLNAVASRFNKSNILKAEFSAGISGLNELVKATGKSSVQTLTEDRVVKMYKKREIIYAEGGNPHRLYYLQKGKVKACVTNDDGKELVLNLYTAGDFFGYMALLEDTVYMESAEAIEDAEIAFIPRQEFESLLNNDKEITQKFIQLLSNNIREKEKKLLDLAYSSLRKRVANTLLNLYNKYNETDIINFSIDMSRENLANITGTTKESLVRTLSDFKDEKIIDIKSAKIHILDKKKLRNLAG